jgi:hypothetical protein
MFDPVFLLVLIPIEVPAILIGLAFCRLYQSSGVSTHTIREARYTLVAITASYLWLFASLFNRSFFNSPTYGAIVVNLINLSLASIFTLIRGREAQMRLFFASLMTASIWFLLLAVKLMPLVGKLMPPIKD